MECHLWVLNVAHLICTETGDKSDGLNLDSEIYTLVIVCLKHASIYRYIYIVCVTVCTYVHVFHDYFMVSAPSEDSEAWI